MHIGMPDSELLLFDLENDPLETKNLAEQHPDQLNEMAALLEKIRQEFTIKDFFND